MLDPHRHSFLYLSQVFYKIQKKKIINTCIKRRKILLKVPKITWVSLYGEKTKITLNFTKNYKNSHGGACSSPATIIGGRRSLYLMRILDFILNLSINYTLARPLSNKLLGAGWLWHETIRLIANFDPTVVRRITSRVTAYWESFMSTRTISRGTRRSSRWKTFQVILSNFL